jgi:RNA polymerase sigma factor (TIGR02999 family)
MSGRRDGDEAAMSSSSEITRTLISYSRGDAAALEVLLPAVYDELRRLAAAQLQHERAGHTLQPTALAHEAFLRLVNQRDVTWQNRAHFLGVAAQAMRRILADHARRRRAEKRGGDAVRVTIDESNAPAAPSNVMADELDTALEDLARLEPRHAKIVELRFFGGLTIEETAEVVGVSPATVKRDWLLARAWLYRELQEGK